MGAQLEVVVRVGCMLVVKDKAGCLAIEGWVENLGTQDWRTRLSKPELFRQRSSALDHSSRLLGDIEATTQVGELEIYHDLLGDLDDRESTMCGTRLQATVKGLDYEVLLAQDCYQCSSHDDGVLRYRLPIEAVAMVRSLEGCISLM